MIAAEIRENVCYACFIQGFQKGRARGIHKDSVVAPFLSVRFPCGP
jgi:hypothetical protein